MFGNIQILLSGNKNVYSPGDTIVGEIVWELSKAPRRVTVSLRWRTDGKGTTDIGTVVETRPAPAHGAFLDCDRANFVIRIPETVHPSYEGQLIAVHWVIHATADLSFSIDPHAEAGVVISRTGVSLRPGGLNVG
ncbi:MAG: hypothetical protein JXX14_19805 [Deltaproteobacteria bacterium]|nr:hypothetical protein [Deltaproteobacteria bacterium]